MRQYFAGVSINVLAFSGLIIARATAQARPQLSRKVLRTLRELAGTAEAAASH